MASRRFRLRLEPYNPDARDADGDGIVQEGTAWERPAGAKILNELGEEIKRGILSSKRNEKFSVVDRDGKRIDYIPSYAKQAKIPTERPKTSLEKRGVQTIKSRGVRNVDEVVTEAAALSRASAPGTPRQDEPVPVVRSSGPDVPADKPKVPAELTMGPELVADLVEDVKPIQALKKPRSDGYMPIKNDIAIISAKGSTADLFGWEETPEGEKALNAILEAGDRAVLLLEESLAKTPLTDEIRKELDDFRKRSDQRNEDNQRILNEIHRLKFQAWLDQLNLFKSILLSSDNGNPTESEQIIDGIIKRVSKKLDKFDKDSKIGEVITKKDMEEIAEILQIERKKAFQAFIRDNDPDNYDRWFDSNGNRVRLQAWVDSVAGDDDDLYDKLLIEEKARQEKLLETADWPLGQSLIGIFIQEKPRVRLNGDGPLLGSYTTGAPGFPAKETRELTSDRFATDRYEQEIADLTSELNKPVMSKEDRQRFLQIDPLSSSEENARAVLDLIGRVRSDLGTGDFLGYFDPNKIEANSSDAGISGVTKDDMIKAINDANAKLPGTWVSRFRAHFGSMKRNDLKFLKRGHFSSGSIRLSNGQYGWRSVLIHELTHGFENSVPGLYLAERLFYNRRARSIPKNKLVRKYYGTGQYYWDLQLSDSYASVYYVDHYLEIATMSMEALLQGNIRNMPPDQLRFILGCMLLL